MNKKDLLDNIRDYSPKEIADAIKSGLVTFYELRSSTHGQFTPMLQRQVQLKLAEKEEPATTTQSEASQAQEEIFVPEEPAAPTRPAEPEAFKPIESGPFKPIEPEPFKPAYETVQQVQQEPVYPPAFEQVQQPRQQVSPPFPPTDDSSNAPSDTPKCLNKFSWGGLIFGWLWGVCNGVNWALITIALGVLADIFLIYAADPFLENGVPAILWVAIIVINFILGFRGNRMAWKSKRHASAEAFDTAQAIWRKAAFIVLGISVGLIILLTIIGIAIL